MTPTTGEAGIRVTAGSPADHRALVDAIYDRSYDTVHRAVQEALRDKLFEPREGLTHAQRAGLAYRRAGFLGERFPVWDGHTLDHTRIMALLDWSAVADCTASTILLIHYTLFMCTVAANGRGRADLDPILSEAASMRSTGVFLATELGHGNDLAHLETEAVYDPATDEFVLNTPTNAAQKFMPNTVPAATPKIAVVLARLVVSDEDHGVFPFLVPLGDRSGSRPGVRVVPLPEKPTLSLDNGLTAFDNVRVPRGHLLSGRAGTVTDDGRFVSDVPGKSTRFALATSALIAGRVGIPSGLAACARAALYITVRYSLRRTTSGVGRKRVAIISYRNHQLALFRGMAETYALSFLANHAKRRFVAAQEEQDPELTVLVGITKALVGWSARDVVEMCRERCGAPGMFGVNRIAEYVGLVQAGIPAEGDNQVVLAAAAGRMLGRPGPTPEVPDPAGRSLTDLLFLRAVLDFRADALHAETRARLMRAARDSGSGLDAWNAVADAALAVATARGVATAMELFAEEIDRAGSETARSGLTLLATMFGVTWIGRESGWLLASHALTAEQVLEVPEVANRLCAEILPLAGLLVDGFAVTNAELRAPLAEPDYQDFYRGDEVGVAARERLGVARGIRGNGHRASSPSQGGPPG
ncbi:acyl-CoA dehydrogenase [Amycolatopsis alba]|uniref:Acyl-CoA oxidase n=1 Tax=Amycolatopsis alba DSM 44262 TaxID=1125972 RepID=A0A229RL23_AMYAL|nr:acyl-CoA dehydrogenase [Amycolatopsis alba]OXM47347.1 acyl-CoA oxidase [Amycolatopsis alba DSM 44262]